jgi:hypothetical protein
VEEHAGLKFDKEGEQGEKPNQIAPKQKYM